MEKNKKAIGIVVAVIVFLLIGGIYFFKGQNELGKNNNLEEVFVEEKPVSKESEIQIKDTSIIVDIKGEVKNPGVYKLKEGSIIEDLIKEAGGITKDGDLEGVNRAKLLANNEAIVIPNKNQENAGPAFNNTSPKLDANGKTGDKVNINTASVEELDGINGIGPSKAAAIVSYREENGGFKSIEDLTKVSGIGKSTFEKIKDSICI